MQALKALVILLGVLIVLAAGFIAVTLYKRGTAKIETGAVAAGAQQSGRESAPPSALQSFGAKHIAIPQGAHVEEMVTTQGRLIVRLRLADGSSQALIIDSATGAVLGELDFAPAP